MAEIIQFPGREVTHVDIEQNFALRAVRDYFERIHPGRTTARVFVSPEEAAEALPDADYFLAWLWSEGFKIVPTEDSV